MIRFRISKESALVLNPLQGFALEAQPTEYRVDPLIGPSSTFHTLPASSTLYRTDETIIEKLVRETEVNCLFCPDKVRTSTPEFSAELIPEGRETRGEATMFPNLFAQKGHSAVIALTRKHFLTLDEFHPDTLYNAFRLADFYLRRAYKLDAIKYAEIGYSAPLSKEVKYLWAGGKIVSRSSVQSYPTNDIWYGPNLLLYGFITMLPEKLATTIRPYCAEK